MLVGDEEVEEVPPAQRAVGDEAADGGEVVRFLAEPLLVEALDRDVAHGRRVEALERGAAGAADARRLVLEPHLVRPPSQTFWQLTKAKRTGRGPSSSGAVRARPMRLPLPFSSVKRYQ